MARLEDKIAEIKDPELRREIAEEAKALKDKKQFGLVFETHQPEVVPMFRVPVRRGSTVAKKNGRFLETWHVVRVQGSIAELVKDADDSHEMALMDSLVVVRRMGEPIYPALVPKGEIIRADPAQPHHLLIEADNYHALQLLEYVYRGQVDCIYIDPPYNTGARDWKYNNDYVDKNDSWRHSKWLAMMARRLRLAKRLLNPESGVLIVTIDEHEVHHLRCLLSEVFPESFIQMITTVTNPKGVSQGRFSRVEEYIIFCFMDSAYVPGAPDDLLGKEEASTKIPRWSSLLRSGSDARRIDRKNMFYPVLIDQANMKVVGTGEPLINRDPDLGEQVDGYAAAWPIRSDGSYGRWGISYIELRKLIDIGYVWAKGYNEKRKTFSIYYINEKLREQIEAENILVTGRNSINNVVEIEYASGKIFQPKTVWHRSVHDAGAHGADLLKTILGRSGSFTFPKSVYSVRDSLASVVRNNKKALIIDFFSGSGTTLHATNLLNFADGGQRCCIMVTNNEVSEKEAKTLSDEGYHPGDTEWEKHGICQSVTWPRCKYTIIGKRDDGTELEGRYFSGRIVTKEKPRRFKQISFTSSTELKTAEKKKQLMALIEGIQQSSVKRDSAFVISDEDPASILFDEDQADAWIDALEDKDHITDFYIVTDRKAIFGDLKERINELLGPIIVTEEEKRPMRDGFAANLEYFKIDFIEKDQVALGRQFAAILPILWMIAGAKGKVPAVPAPHAHWLIPDGCPFAVLMKEGRFREFLTKIRALNDLTHVFLVTNSDSAFYDMRDELPESIKAIQLYNNYLDNFKININRQ